MPISLNKNKVSKPLVTYTNRHDGMDSEIFKSRNYLDQKRNYNEFAVKKKIEQEEKWKDNIAPRTIHSLIILIQCAKSANPDLSDFWDKLTRLAKTLTNPNEIENFSCTLSRLRMFNGGSQMLRAIFDSKFREDFGIWQKKHYFLTNRICLENFIVEFQTLNELQLNCELIQEFNVIYPLYMNRKPDEPSSHRVDSPRLGFLKSESFDEPFWEL